MNKYKKKIKAWIIVNYIILIFWMSVWMATLFGQIDFHFLQLGIFFNIAGLIIFHKMYTNHDVCEICRTKRFDRGHCTKKVTCQDLKLIYNDGKSIFNDKEKKDLFTAI